MKYVILFFLLTFSIHSKERIVVLDFVHSSNVSLEIAISSHNYFISKLTETEQYSIIEKSQLQEILKEVEFQQTGCTDTVCEIKIGEMLAADKIASGNIIKKDKKYIITITIRNVKDKSLELSETIDLYDLNKLEIAMNSLTQKMIPSVDLNLAKRNEKLAKYESISRSALWRTLVMPGWGHTYLDKTDTGVGFITSYLGNFGILYMLSNIRQAMKKDIEAEVNTIRYEYYYAAQTGNTVASNPFIYPYFIAWGNERISHKTQDIDSTLAIGSAFPIGVIILALVDVQRVLKYNEKDSFSFSIKPDTYYFVRQTSNYAKKSSHLEFTYTIRF